MVVSVLTLAAIGYAVSLLVTREDLLQEPMVSLDTWLMERESKLKSSRTTMAVFKLRQVLASPFCMGFVTVLLGMFTLSATTPSVTVLALSYSLCHLALTWSLKASTSSESVKQA